MRFAPRRRMFARRPIVLSKSNPGFQVPAPMRDLAHEARVRAFLGQWGPPVPPQAGDATPIDFVEQCEAILDVGPATVSSIMGVYPPEIVARLKEKNIRWL